MNLIDGNFRKLINRIMMVDAVKELYIEDNYVKFVVDVAYTDEEGMYNTDTQIVVATVRNTHGSDAALFSLNGRTHHTKLNIHGICGFIIDVATGKIT